MSSFMIYGATGYTGALIAEECAKRKLDVVLAARSAEPLHALAQRTGLPHRVLSLDDADALARAIDDVSLVLHCAGPFSRTSRRMADACVRQKKHYLDITGEMAVFEALHARTDEAKGAGVVLMPGVGFDVVPSDCLAAHVARRMPDATSLDLCVAAMGSLSHGTAFTMVEHAHNGGAVRRGGTIVEEPLAARHRTFTVDGKARDTYSTPWGDVATAWHSTKIPDITVYFPFDGATLAAIRAMRLARPLLAFKPVRRFVQSFVPAGGPSTRRRARGRSVIVAEASNGKTTVSSTLTGPEAYTFTVETAILCAQRVLSQPPPPGTHTPSTAFGPDLVLEVQGVTRTDA